MLKVKFLVPLALLVLFLYLKYVVYQPPAELRQIQFNGSIQSVQDSMEVLQRICESVKLIEPGRIMNCKVRQSDRILSFKGKPIGKLDTVSVLNDAFADMQTEDARKLLSVVKFLNRNFISGVYHDTSIGQGFWLYPYRAGILYNGRAGRSLYIWNDPQDTLSPAFKHYFTIRDRKKNLVLLSHNHVN